MTCLAHALLSGALLVLPAHGMSSASRLNARDFVSIQAAIDSLPRSGGVVYIPGSADLPGGAYSPRTHPSFGYAQERTALRIPAGKIVHLLGDGKDVTILRAAEKDSDLVQVLGDKCIVEGLTLDNAQRAGAERGHSRGIVIGRASDAGSAVTGVSVRDCRVVNSPGWPLYVKGTNESSIAILCTYDNVQLWGNRNPQQGAIYIGPGCTTQTFRDCYVQPFTGYGALLDHAEGITFANCAFEGQQSHDVPYVFVKGSNVVGFDRCWFEAHGAADTTRFIRLLGALHSVDIIGCRFARDTLADSANAIQIDGTCKSVVILDPEMAIPKFQPLHGAGDIAITNADASPVGSSEVTVIGGIVATNSTFRTPVLADRSPRTSLQSRARMPRLTDAQIAALPSPKVGDMVLNTTTNRIDVFLGPEGWVGVTTGAR